MDVVPKARGPYPVPGDAEPRHRGKSGNCRCEQPVALIVVVARGRRLLLLLLLVLLLLLLVLLLVLVLVRLPWWLLVRLTVAAVRPPLHLCGQAAAVARPTAGSTVATAAAMRAAKRDGAADGAWRANVPMIAHCGSWPGSAAQQLQLTATTMVMIGRTRHGQVLGRRPAVDQPVELTQPAA